MDSQSMADGLKLLRENLSLDVLSKRMCLRVYPAAHDRKLTHSYPLFCGLACAQYVRFDVDELYSPSTVTFILQWLTSA